MTRIRQKWRSGSVTGPRVKTSARQNWPGQVDAGNGEENKFRGKRVKIQRIYVAVADDRSSPMENATGVNRRWLRLPHN